MTALPPNTVVTDPETLAALAERLRQEEVVAVDLEADSLHHYREKVCLLQVATEHEAAVIDPLVLPDLSPLAPVFSDPSIRKVFHGADYDIRSLHRDFGISVANLFDTMVASQFLGEKEVGLAAMLKSRFGVELDKRYQRADWSRRPLTEGMILYAVEDTRLLVGLYRLLRDDLAAKGRLAWVEEECLLLSSVRHTPREDGPLFLRFKGAATLERRSLAVLEELLQYRDAKARERDVPPFKVLPNDALREAAVRKPREKNEVEGIPGLSSSLIERHGKAIIAAVGRGAGLPAARLPVYPARARVVRGGEAETRLKRLKEWRLAKAGELGMDPGVMISGSILEALADLPQGESLKDVRGLREWQKEEFGKDLAEIAGC